MTTSHRFKCCIDQPPFSLSRQQLPAWLPQWLQHPRSRNVVDAGNWSLGTNDPASLGSSFATKLNQGQFLLLYEMRPQPQLHSFSGIYRYNDDVALAGHRAFNNPDNGVDTYFAHTAICTPVQVSWARLMRLPKLWFSYNLYNQRLYEFLRSDFRCLNDYMRTSKFIYQQFRPLGLRTVNGCSQYVLELDVDSFNPPTDPVFDVEFSLFA